MIKLTSENYPISEYYKTDELLTSLGIGEAAISALNEKGIPTPLAATLLCAPKSRMDILTPDELNSVFSNSKIANKYNQTVDRESAYEILNKKLDIAREHDLKDPTGESTNYRTKQTPKPKTSRKAQKSTMEKVISSPLSKQMGRTLVREITRGILGILGVKGRR